MAQFVISPLACQVALESRAVPDSGSGSGRNPAFCPNPAEIRKSSQILAEVGYQPDMQNVMLTGKMRFVYLSFHAIASCCLQDLAQQCVHGSTQSA